jgi:hypothetical protein
MFRHLSQVLAVIALTAVVAACSGAPAATGVASLVDPDASGASGASPSPSAPITMQDAALAFARCMREHGIDMPDPEIATDADGGISISQSGGGGGGTTAAAKEKFTKADAACRHLLEAAQPAGPGRQLSAEDMDKLLAFARCMREHGIPMQDPGPDGGIRIEIKDSGPNGGGDGPKPAGPPDDPKFEAAQTACGSLLPGKMGQPGNNVEGGKTSGGSVGVEPAPAGSN